MLLRLSPVSYPHFVRTWPHTALHPPHRNLHRNSEARLQAQPQKIYDSTCLKGGGKLSKLSPPREIIRKPRFSALISSAKQVTKWDLVHKQHNSATWRETHTTRFRNTLWHKHLVWPSSKECGVDTSVSDCVSLCVCVIVTHSWKHFEDCTTAYMDPLVLQII